MCYAVYKFGLQEAWPELVLNMFYVACLTMIGLYFFNRLDTHRFNYWCSVSVGITVLLLCMLTFFYARKQWKSYTKRDLWMTFLVDVVIAALYNYDISTPSCDGSLRRS